MSDNYSFTRNINTDSAWKYFTSVIKNNFGTAALMAGLYFRSGMDPYTGCEKYGYPNTPELKEFAHDRVGFGIGKWKNWTRKQSLHNVCRVGGESIYDINAQMQFVMDEFSGITYGPVLKGLMEATSVKDAAYLVYDNYLDIKKHSDEKRDACAKLAMDIYTTYEELNTMRIPVKYVKTHGNRVRVKAKKRAFIRKTLGYLKPEEIYKFISVSEDGREYSVYFNDSFGYVNADKVEIVTRMEAIV